MFLVVLILFQKLKCDLAEDVLDRPVLAPLSTQDNCGSFNLSAHVNKYVHIIYFFTYSAFKIGWENSWHFATPQLVSPATWRVGKERRNSIPMMSHYPDLAIASDWIACVQTSPLPQEKSGEETMKQINSTNQKHYPDLGSDASSVLESLRRHFTGNQ